MCVLGIGISTPIKSGYRVKLQVDNSDVDLTENRQDPSWTLTNKLWV
jgi:hypothetical protein